MNLYKTNVFMKHEKNTYETPSINMLTIQTEGVLAASSANSTFSNVAPGDDLDYESIW